MKIEDRIRALENKVLGLQMASIVLTIFVFGLGYILGVTMVEVVQLRDTIQ